MTSLSATSGVTSLPSRHVPASAAGTVVVVVAPFTVVVAPLPVVVGAAAPVEVVTATGRRAAIGTVSIVPVPPSACPSVVDVDAAVVEVAPFVVVVAPFTVVVVAPFTVVGVGDGDAVEALYGMVP